MTLITYSDGGARGNPGPSAIGIVICNEQGDVLQESAQLIGDRTNNQAEYEAMLLALQTAKQLQGTRLKCFADSELLIFQLQGRYRIKDSHLKLLSEKVKSWVSQFESITFQQVPRSHPMISRADKLLNQALDKANLKGKPRATPDTAPKELF